MSLFLAFCFLFFIGSLVGWVLELLYAKLTMKKLINPGFFVGPWVPIYGFGLCVVTFIYIVVTKYDINPFLSIVIMGICLTLIELIAGLIFKKMDVRLWDYSDRWGNYKEIICPFFSTIWLVGSFIYYYLFAPHVINLLLWFSKHLSFSLYIGMFLGLFIVDVFYSFNILTIIRKYAKENNIEVKYEDFKRHIKERQEKRREKYSFIFPFKQTKSVEEYLKSYKKKK